MRRKGLGKGLGALIQFEPPENKKVAGKGLTEIPVNKVSTGRYQPRKAFDDEKMAELVNSVREKGILQPIIVKKAKTGYDLVAGERRWRAAVAAGLKTVPSIVMSLSDMETLEVALVENVHRQDLNPIEEANVYHRLSSEFDLTQEEISKRVGKDRSSVANLLRLLKLSSDIKDDIAANILTMGHARALLALRNPHDQLKLRNLILKKGLSVRETESKIKSLTSGGTKTATEKKDLHHKALEDDLKRSLGTKVSVALGKEGGKIVIHFHSEDELERLLEILTGKK